MITISAKERTVRTMTGNIEVKGFTKGGVFYTGNPARKQRYIKNAKTVLEKFSKHRAMLEDLPEKLYDFKNKSAQIIRSVSESLADRTAQVGLFGEDSAAPYSTTNVDYIPEDALEIKYINLDFQDEQERGKSKRNANILRVFNGF